MCSADTIDLRSTGDYSLRDSVSLAARASFVKDARAQRSDGLGALDLVFSLEGSWNTVGARVEQRDGRVRAIVLSNPGGAATEDIRAQLERVLYLDVDGADLDQVVARDQVVDKLRRQRPGVRPVLFPSPYEAAARAIIGQQLPVRQAAAVHARIAAEHGVAANFGGAIMHAFPAPARLADLPPVRGLSERKVKHLRALAQATVGGWIDTTRLRKMTQDEAMSHLQRMPGIGPSSAELILLRGAGDPDAFPRREKRLHHAMAAAYQLAEESTLDRLERIADGWCSYRSWVRLLLRNAD